MAKKVVAQVKLQCPAGQATPSPPVGPALGQHGVNIMEFCKAFNARTQGMESGITIPVLITIYADRSFTFVTKTPPASVLIKQTVGIAKASAKPKLEKVAKISIKQIEDIAKKKMSDLNAVSLDAAKKTIAGTARSMGIEVVD